MSDADVIFEMESVQLAILHDRHQDLFAASHTCIEEPVQVRGIDAEFSGEAVVIPFALGFHKIANLMPVHFHLANPP